MAKKEKESTAERSMFGHYCTAAVIAARMNISLGYAFDRYVKPKIPNAGVVNFTAEELESLDSFYDGRW